jgi:3-methyladenine DNA glycosylase Mpg
MLKHIKPKRENFDTISDTILNHTLLHSGEKCYRICEIEFYLYSNKHLDEYTHKSEEQQQSCKFYFHKYKTGTYKTGTYKCFDITLGKSNIYFGILVRSIYNVKTKEFIEGPCRSLTDILKQFDCSEVRDFVKDKKLPLDIYDTMYNFYIENHEYKKMEKIYIAPRIGLSNKFPEYQNLNYRYAIKIDKIKKQKKTFTECDM